MREARHSARRRIGSVVQAEQLAILLDNFLETALIKQGIRQVQPRRKQNGIDLAKLHECLIESAAFPNCTTGEFQRSSEKQDGLINPTLVGAHFPEPVVG